MVDPETQPDTSAPQVLLFGHVGAGKSSLLAALVRAGNCRPETLLRCARIRPALRDPRRGLSRAEIARSDTELTSYTIRFKPRHADAVVDSREIVLHDCSGKAAENLIRRPSSLRDPDTNALLPAWSSTPTRYCFSSTPPPMTNNCRRRSKSSTHSNVRPQGKAMQREVGGFPFSWSLLKVTNWPAPATHERSGKRGFTNAPSALGGNSTRSSRMPTRTTASRRRSCHSVASTSASTRSRFAFRPWPTRNLTRKLHFKSRSSFGIASRMPKNTANA